MECITTNPNFDSLEGWFAQSGGDSNCRLHWCDSNTIPGVLPPAGNGYAILKGRKQTWNSIAQNVTGKFKANTSYVFRSHVRFLNASGRPVEQGISIAVTFCLKDEQNRLWSEHPFRQFGRVLASENEWRLLEGKIPSFDALPPRVTVYVEGPPAGIDLLVGSLSIFPVSNPPDLFPLSPKSNRVQYQVNIIKNGDFSRGTLEWKTMTGAEKMTVHPASSIGNPNGPPSESSSLATTTRDVLSGPTAPYLVVSNRKAYWQGPKQEITGSILPFVTYAVYAWVRVGISDPSIVSKDSPGLIHSILNQNFSQEVNFALSVNDRWVNGGMAEAVTFEWRRLYGSFRIEEDVRRVSVYFQGPSPDVDIWVADIQVLAVDGLERVEELKIKADKIRKRDIQIRIKNSEGKGIPHARIQVHQTQRKFPLGSCMNSRDFKNPKYLEFFRSHFNIAVFENEFKWTSMERARGKVNYEQVDSMLGWAQAHGILCRAHCVFWDNAVPDWAKKLSDEELAVTIDSRIVEITSRYCNKFVNYDVNNEMLHGGYFANRLGTGIIARMFQLLKQMDSNASLFLNDYHVEDGKDAKSSPQKYGSQARRLLSMNAPVGGLGIQGHLYAPVGLNIRHSLDLLRSEIHLPVWFTEVDVSSIKETVRADDLEIVLREAFAHESVEGILLWGFWEGGELGPAMAIKNAFLVNSDWSLNEAGRRFEALMKEWTTPDLQGTCDESGVYKFRGYLGKYAIRVNGESEDHMHEFEIQVDKEEGVQHPCCINITL